MTRPEKKERNNPELLAGIEVAKMVEGIFDQLPIELACRLVDSNVVLTLAGLKPETEFHIPIPSNESLIRIKNGTGKLFEYFHSKLPEVRFTIMKVTKARSNNERILIFEVKNLKGYEYRSNKTSIPEITPFKRKDGWERCFQWIQKTQKILKRKYSEHFSIGFLLGYPDQTLYDGLKNEQSGEDYDTLQNSHIPGAEIYDESSPNYDFYPESSNHPEIRENITIAGKILKDFYKSEWHRKNVKRLSFHLLKNNPK